MKFLLMAVAIMSSYGVCDAVEELSFPEPFGALTNDGSTTCEQIKRGALGDSLKLSPKVKQVDFEESLDSPPKDASGSDQFDELAEVCFVSTSEESEGGLTPQAEVGASPSLKPDPADSSQNTESGFNKHLLSLPFQDAGEGRHPLKRLDPVGSFRNRDVLEEFFSETTYNLLVRGMIRVGSVMKPVQSQGSETPFLSYIQRVSFDMDEVDEIYWALDMNMKEEVIADFIFDCHKVNPTLNLTPEQAAAILDAVRVDLLYIIYPWIKRKNCS